MHAGRLRGGRACGRESRRRRSRCRNGETLDQLLARLKPAFFDPNVDPTITAKTPPAGKDILTASANNLYVGVTMKDLEGFDERVSR